MARRGGRAEVRSGTIMVRSGHAAPVDEVPDLGYRNPDRPRLGVEVFDYRALATRVSAATLARAHRIEFHQVILVTGGHGTAMVDFVDHACTAGTVIHVVPGQVQRLPQPLEPGGLRAAMVVFTPAFPSREHVDTPWAGGAWQAGPGELTRLRRAMDDVAAEYRHAIEPGATADLTVGLLRHLVGALLLRVARLSPPGPAGPAGEVYQAFRRELERSFARTRSTVDYAARTGYSPRTLSRACRAATGHTAKQLVDDRVALEAKRLLVHTDLSAAAISARLGFTEPTNFGKFFTRAAGLPPDTFRRQERSPLGDPGAAQAGRSNR
jgi:AraC-like DNA-binding protein